MSFDYTLNLLDTWPPQGRPQPPFGPSAIEVMRSCPLRSSFESSPSYERRMGTAARIGTALHKTLQSFNDHPIQTSSPEQKAGEAQHRFYRELQSQKSQAAERPRESSLPWDSKRIERSLEAAIAEVLRPRTLGDTSTELHHRTPGPQAIPPSLLLDVAPESHTSQVYSFEVEVPVYSQDKLYWGRVDLAEHTPAGVRIIDYKSAYRDDLPERYERQLQFYAYLWHQTRHQWPIEAQVFYPLRGVFYSVSVQEEACRSVVQEASALVKRVLGQPSIADLASPGDVCKICEFRPWCQPFWFWQSSEKSQLHAVDRAAIGFEGQIENISLGNHYWVLTIAWRNSQVRLKTPQERFPHLAKACPGQAIRVLDTSLKGQPFQPSVQIYEQSEIFLLV